jgi:periplasmic divalent cation tolerance protein
MAESPSIPRSILSVTTTVASAEDARQLAEALVEHRLAACVQVESGLVSHYRWEGTDCAEPEWRLTIKTLPDCLVALEAFLAQHHPYDLPQLLSQPMTASPRYADWIASLVGPAPAA